MKTVQQLAEWVSEQYGIAVAELVGADRTQHLHRARWVLMWVLRKRGMSYSQIGKQLGRDHTTVISNLKKMPEELDQSELEEAWRFATSGAKRAATAQQEIIEINLLLQGTIKAEAMDAKTGAIVSHALNRLQSLASDAQRLLSSGDET